MIIHNAAATIELFDADNYDYSGTHMGDRKITVTLQSSEPIDFNIGDYVEYGVVGSRETFTLQTAPIATRVYNSTMLQYTCIFWSSAYELTITNFLDVVNADEPANAYFTGTGDVYFEGNVQSIADRLEANLDRIYLFGRWTFNIHATVDLDIYKTIVAENLSCWDVLLFVNTEFGLDFTIDLSQNIYIGYPTTSGGAELEFGKDNGLCEINKIQNDQKIITRVYALGDTRNVPPDYRIANPGEYHPRIMLPAASCPDGYLENATLAALYPVREAFYINEDIYPHQTFTVKSVDPIYDSPTPTEGAEPIAKEVLLKPAHWSTIKLLADYYSQEWTMGDGSWVVVYPAGRAVFTDITDIVLPDESPYTTTAGETITLVDGGTIQMPDGGKVTLPDGGEVAKYWPEQYGWKYVEQDPDQYTTVTIYVETTLDINEDDVKSPVDATASFRTGYLQGTELKVITWEQQLDALGVPVVPTTYKVKLQRDSNSENYQLPNANVPIITGDEFTLLNIYLPDSYVADAEAALLADATLWLAEHSKSPEGYSIKVPEEYAQRAVDALLPGEIGTSDDIRVQLKEGFPVLLTQDDVIVPADTAIIIQSITISYKEDRLLPTYELVVSPTPIKGYIKRIDAELSAARQQAVINNVTTTNQVETNLKSATIFQNNITNEAGDIYGNIIAPVSILPISLSVELRSTQYILQAFFYVNYLGDPDEAYGTEGVLIQKESDIVWGGVYDLDHQTWTIAAGQTFTLDPAKYYWVYVKCDISDGSAIWVVSETKIDATSIEGYYMFEWGQINPSIDGYRFSQNIYGINGIDSFVYIGYASDDEGTDFTLTNDAELDYMAILSTTTALNPAAVGDFDGLWFKRVGDNANVEAGDGMDFTTGQPVDMGTPSEVNSETDNEVTETSHTHKLGDVPVSGVKDGVPVEYGALYNWYAAVDTKKITSSDDWAVPTSTQLNTLRTTVGADGGKLKETGVVYWNDPNNGATNQYGFNGRGAGERISDYSNFSLILKIMASDELSSVNSLCLQIRSTDTNMSSVGQTKYCGLSIRLLYVGTGTPTSYTGNDGKVYPVCQVGSQYYISCNLAETQYRNGDWIAGFDGGVYTPIDNTTWAGLTTGAMCIQEDDEANSGGEIPLEGVLDSLQEQIDNIPEINANYLKDWIEFEFRDIEAGTAADYVLDLKALVGYTIDSAVMQVDTGTLTVAVKIGTTAVTGLSAVAVDTDIDETAATAANTVSAGDKVILSVSTTYTGAPTLIRGKLNLNRT